MFNSGFMFDWVRNMSRAEKIYSVLGIVYMVGMLILVPYIRNVDSKIAKYCFYCQEYCEGCYETDTGNVVCHGYEYVGKFYNMSNISEENFFVPSGFS